MAARNRNLGFVSVDGFPNDVIIEGPMSLNRALHGQSVLVRLSVDPRHAPPAPAAATGPAVPPDVSAAREKLWGAPLPLFADPAVATRATVSSTVTPRGDIVHVRTPLKPLELVTVLRIPRSTSKLYVCAVVCRVSAHDCVHVCVCVTHSV